jgi:hypothetical protein
MQQVAAAVFAGFLAAGLGAVGWKLDRTGLNGPALFVGLAIGGVIGGAATGRYRLLIPMTVAAVAPAIAVVGILPCWSGWNMLTIAWLAAFGVYAVSIVPIAGLVGVAARRGRGPVRLESLLFIVAGGLAGLMAWLAVASIAVDPKMCGS